MNELKPDLLQNEAQALIEGSIGGMASLWPIPAGYC
jgi:hypothetical protein